MTLFTVTGISQSLVSRADILCYVEPENDVTQFESISCHVFA